MPPERPGPRIRRWVRIGSSEIRRTSPSTSSDSLRNPAVEGIVRRAIGAQQMLDLHYASVAAGGEAVWNEHADPFGLCCQGNDGERMFRSGGLENFGFTPLEYMSGEFSVAGRIHPDDRQRYESLFSPQSVAARIIGRIPVDTPDAPGRETFLRTISEIADVERQLAHEGDAATEDVRLLRIRLSHLQHDAKTIFNKSGIIGRSVDCREEFRLDRGGGEYQWVAIRQNTFILEDGKLLTEGSIRDATQLRLTRQQQELERRRTDSRNLTDAVTGLWGRRVLDGQLAGVWENGAVRENALLVVLDLNFFKEINDTYGHQIGDRILRAIAERLSGSIMASKSGFVDEIDLEKDDFIGRFGGDELFIVFKNITDRKKAMQVLTRLASQFARPVGIDGQAYQVSASIGAAFGNQADSLAQWIDRADVSMYHAKAKAHGAVFSDDSQSHPGAFTPGPAPTTVVELFDPDNDYSGAERARRAKMEREAIDPDGEA